MEEAKSLRVEAVSSPPILYVRLYGVIDETFDIEDIMNAGEGQDLILNIKAISRISSFGVREWLAFVATSPRRGNSMRSSSASRRSSTASAPC